MMNRNNNHPLFIQNRLWMLISIWTLAVIGLGAYTRLSDAGLGCPDWPGCYGQWIVESSLIQESPDSNFIKAWIEMIHRYLAGSLGIMIVFTTIKSWRHSQLSLYFTISMIALIVFQALLGMWTVTLKLNPLIVSLHLVGGMALFLGSLKAQTATMIRPVSSLSPLLMLSRSTIACYFFQVLLGAWVSTNYAGLSCANLWSCTPFTWTDISDATLQTIFDHTTPLVFYSTPQKAFIQLIHRMNALLLGFFIWKLRQLTWHFQDRYRYLMDIAVLLYLLQIGVGISIVVFYLPFSLALFHNILAILLSIPLWTFYCSFSFSPLKKNSYESLSVS